MNMTNRHTGKIGWLPKNIRDQLGLRLEDGQAGSEIVPWLNALPEAQMTQMPEEPAKTSPEKAQKTQNSNQFKLIQTKTELSVTGSAETSDYPKTRKAPFSR
jgi:hypothetical protein